MRYLCVPLILRRSTEKEYKPSADKITTKINSWSIKPLLADCKIIKSELFSLQGYLSRMFILPKKVVKEGEKKLNCLLWKVSDHTTAGAMVR